MNEIPIKPIIEAIIMTAGKPLPIKKIIELFDDEDKPDTQAVTAVLEALQQDYENKGVELVEVASGFRFQARQQYAPWLSKMWEEKPARYSRALLETLALIAYRQPITRADIENIRGVSVSTSIVKTLMEREWVRVVGHKDVPGRPALYATTRQFLDYFNLKSLEELPSLVEIKDLDYRGETAENHFQDEESVSSNRIYKRAAACLARSIQAVLHPAPVVTLELTNDSNDEQHDEGAEVAAPNDSSIDTKTTADDLEALDA